MGFGGKGRILEKWALHFPLYPFKGIAIAQHACPENGRKVGSRSPFEDPLISHSSRA